MKTSKINQAKKIALTLTLAFSPMCGFAQAWHPPVTSSGQIDPNAGRNGFSCEAECFSIGSDGSSLFYEGKFLSDVHLERRTAFRELKYWCPGLLVKRTLKGIHDEVTLENHYDQSWHINWWRDNQTTHTRSYQIINHQSRATFEAVEATEENSCNPDSIDDNEVPSCSGDGHILG